MNVLPRKRAVGPKNNNTPGKSYMPHCTTESRKRGEPIAGPWLISMPFWANSLKHVDADGMTVLHHGWVPYGRGSLFARVDRSVQTGARWNHAP